ncbi:MAG: MgtC/SapB family protein [Halodesulfurarchaeum sp.]
MLSDLVYSGDVAKVAVSIALGLFFGIEREGSHKPAGIRTFPLVSVLGTSFALVDLRFCAGSSCIPILTAAGGLLVAILAGVLLVRGLLSRTESLYLTTAVSLFVAYGVGVLVALDFLLTATVVTVVSSILLVYKPELHGLAWGLSREELLSVGEFAILAFVVYPLLPRGSIPIAELGISVEPRVVWLMVVFVAGIGIGIVNYAFVKTYGGRAVAVTGFFGGLVSSTAVVGAMLDHAGRDPDGTDYAVSAVMLAISAMALRNLVLAMLFTTPTHVLLSLAAPLGVIVVGGIAFGVYGMGSADGIEFGLDSPFSLRYALTFGAMFALVTVVGSLAERSVGAAGVLVSAFVSGFLSSAAATTSVVVLFRAGTIETSVMTLAVLLATAASVLVKVGLAVSSSNRYFVKGVVSRAALLLGGAGVVAIVLTM